MLTRARQGRDGFTLVELLIALVLFGIIMASLMTMLVRQQGFYRSAEGLMNARGQLRQLLGVLPADLRGVSPAGGDIYAMSDHLLEIRSTFGSSIMCRRDSSTAFVVPPTSLANGNGLTAWLTQPAVGDSMMIFDEGATGGPADDSWKAYTILTITAVHGVNGCTVASGLVSASDTSKSSYRIMLAAAGKLDTNIVVGAPIRFFRRAHYELYQATDNLWYLGYYDCLSSRGTPCNSLQTLSGPYLPYVSSTSSGLLFSYYDSTGATLTANVANAAKVASILVKTYAQTAQVNINGMATGTRTDSMSMSVGLRNRH